VTDNDMKREVGAARTSALVVLSPWRKTIEVTGKDRLTWLNGLVTCELAKRVQGDAVYGLFVAKNGRVLADVAVVIDEARALLSVPASQDDAIRTHLDHYLIMEDAEVAPRDADSDADSFDTYDVHGPRARDVLLAARAAGGSGGKLDRTGLGGAIILAPKDRARDVRAAIERALLSAESGGAPGSFGDENAWDALRLEQAVPRYGVDFDGSTYPQEAGLEKTAVSFAKGCYLGQEVVCMLEMRGKVNRRLVRLEVTGGAVPERGANVTAEGGAVCGQITSAVVSPSLAHPVALAMVKSAHAEAGTVLHVGGVEAKIVGAHFGQHFDIPPPTH
jgi:folate-binding protein YgfZ